MRQWLAAAVVIAVAGVLGAWHPDECHFRSLQLTRIRPEDCMAPGEEQARDGPACGTACSGDQDARHFR